MVNCLVVVSSVYMCAKVRGSMVFHAADLQEEYLGLWDEVIKLVRDLNYLEKPKLNSASAGTVG